MGNYYSITQIEEIGNELTNNNENNDNNYIKYGCKKDKYDHRDLRLVFNRKKLLANKKSHDLRDVCPPIYNQGKLGSCTANAICGLYEFDELFQSENENNELKFRPSRLFLYYNERDMEGNTGTDAGAEIRDGMKSINRIGVCSETEWPYDISTFTEKPSNECYESAKDHHTIKYRRLNHNINQFKACISSGFPFVFGFQVFESFETKEVAETGDMVMPQDDEKVLGGHAIMAVGYDDDKQVFIIQNSWGEEWGDKGYFYMPYEFIKNQEWCSDFWTCSKVSENNVELRNSETQCNIKRECITSEAQTSEEIRKSIESSINTSTSTCQTDTCLKEKND